MDDAKNDNRREYLAEAALLPGQEQLALDGNVNQETGEVKQKKKEKDAPQQMRYTVEMLAAGAVLYQRIDLVDMNDLELGAFVSALAEFSKHPYIGGKSGTGHGLCDIEYTWRPAGTNQNPEKFMAIGPDVLWLSEPAKQAQQTYDQFLLNLYNQYLEEKIPELKQLLAGGGK